MLELTLRDIKTNLQLQEEDLTALTGATQVQLDEPLSDVLAERIGIMLGLELEELMRSAEQPPALASLARSSGQSQALAQELTSQRRLAFGMFVLRARRLASIDDTTQTALMQLREALGVEEGKPAVQAKQLAQQVRDSLGLDDEPIPSMRQLIEELVRAVMSRYGAGLEMTLNTLYNLGHINRAQENFLREQSISMALPYEHPDVIDIRDIGLDQGPLLRAVQRQLAAGTLRPARAAPARLGLDPAYPLRWPRRITCMGSAAIHRRRTASASRAILFAHTGANRLMITALTPKDDGWLVSAMIGEDTREFLLSPSS